MQELVRLAEGVREFIHHDFISASVAPRHFLAEMAQYRMCVGPCRHMLHSCHEYMSVSCSYCCSSCRDCYTYSSCYSLCNCKACKRHTSKIVISIKCLVVQIDGFSWFQSLPHPAEDGLRSGLLHFLVTFLTCSIGIRSKK